MTVPAHALFTHPHTQPTGRRRAGACTSLKPYSFFCTGMLDTACPHSYSRPIKKQCRFLGTRDITICPWSQVLEACPELRQLVRQLGRGGGKGPLRRAPEEVCLSIFTWFYQSVRWVGCIGMG